MITAWIAENGLHCTLNIGMWDAQGVNESKAWGILLADIVRHVAQAVEKERGVSAEETIRVIASALFGELDDPTSETRGDYSPGHS